MQTNRQLQAEAHRILAQAEFVQAGKEQNAWNPLQSLLEKLHHWHWPGPSMPSPVVSVLQQGVLWGLILLLLVPPVYMLIFWGLKWIQRPKQARENLNSIRFSVREAARESWVKRSEQASQAGQYREALHYLFLAAVSLVIKAPLFHHMEALTSRELLHALDVSEAHRLLPLFQKMLQWDEPRWFGKQPTLLDDVIQFQGLFTEFQVQVKQHGR